MKIFRSGMANMTPNPATEAGNLSRIDIIEGEIEGLAISQNRSHTGRPRYR